MIGIPSVIRGKSRSSRCLWLLLMCLWIPFAGAEDKVLTIEGTRILGDQESPTVLYLIPWQPPEIEALASSGGNFMIDRSLRPLERAPFQRLLSYHRRFQSEWRNRMLKQTGERPAEGLKPTSE